MRDTDVSHLHPRMRDAVVALERACSAQGLPLRLYEGWRDPRRQAELYARGRVPGIGIEGKHATRAQAWRSLHQYGFAADFVFYRNGLWSWSEPTPGAWGAYHKLAKQIGLEPLSFEKPHVQLTGADMDVTLLGKGVYPPGGDESWSKNLDAAIMAWGPLPRMAVGIKHPAAPPSPDVDERPDLDTTA